MCDTTYVEIFKFYHFGKKLDFSKFSMHINLEISPHMSDLPTRRNDYVPSNSNAFFQTLKNLSNLKNKKNVLIHPTGTSTNFAFCEEIRKFGLAFTMVVYEKIFWSINK